MKKLKNHKSILICPLNWGIGHASRCIPIIRCLNQLGHRVVIAADSKPLALLKSVFPDNEFITFPGYEPNYSHGNSLVVKMLIAAPKILSSFKKDEQFVEKIIKQYNIDGLISDNRFGASCPSIPSIFITHQLNIQTPAAFNFTRPIINYLNNKYIRNFTTVWIPDFALEPSLSGKLSHTTNSELLIQFIGPLSRFTDLDIIQSEPIDQDIDLLLMLSGPEPQRSILEKLILDQLHQTQLKCFILRGLPGESQLPIVPANIILKNHLNQHELLSILARSKKIVARAGYSTIMDLFSLKRQAILIPTPGQTEQEYLAKHLNNSKQFVFITQDAFTLERMNHIQFSTLPTEIRPSEALEPLLQTWISTLA